MTITRQGILGYCSATMAFQLLSSAFNFYYVKVYLNFYHIDEKWFQLAQVLYLVWNAINDPLFAYVQDNCTQFTFTKSRRESILYSGPLFALSFLIPWVELGNGSWIVGIHLIVTLFLWDTMYTFAGLALCALFTELSHEQADRIALVRYAQIASLFGSPSVMLLEFTSDSLHNFKAFQITAIAVAVCAALLFRYTGLNAHTKYDLAEKKNSDKEEEASLQEGYCKQACQLLTDRNFISFVSTNFCQIFHETFLESFMVIICDQLISDAVISSSTRKLFYGSIDITSNVVVILLTPFLYRFSYAKVIRCSYVLIVALGLAMLYIGPDHPWCLMLFLVMDRCVVSSIFGLFIMPLADIADDNKVKYNRKQPISSMVFGTNALITKPAQSFSPMLAVAVLNSYGYSQLKDKSLMASSDLRGAMFSMACYYPIVLGCIQFILWSFFRMNHNIPEEKNILV